MAVNFKYKCSEIAELINGNFIGFADEVITGVNNIEFAELNEITFLSSEKYTRFLNTTNASCIIVPNNFETKDYPNKNYILSDNPHKRFGQLLIHISTLIEKEFSIHRNLVIHESSVIEGNKVMIGANVVIGKNCKISNQVMIYPNVTIYDNVEIGEGTTIHAGCIICDDTKVGKNCMILPGAVIGSDGFGFEENPDGSYNRIPQLGNVVIEDNVEVGANTTIDRALVGSTIIRDGVKLDNLIQIAHNVRIGENTAMAAQTGVAGSAHVGKRNKIGGQVGIIGHIEVADDVVVLAQSGISKAIDKKGVYFGSPAQDRLSAFKSLALLNQLPELIKEIRLKLKD
jgi:UDP-3-O-[3-hydroxymyristoyl] glucosamine N-acyltransferase